MTLPRLLPYSDCFLVLTVCCAVSLTSHWKRYRAGIWIQELVQKELHKYKDNTNNLWSKNVSTNISFLKCSFRKILSFWCIIFINLYPNFYQHILIQAIRSWLFFFYIPIIYALFLYIYLMKHLNSSKTSKYCFFFYRSLSPTSILKKWKDRFLIRQHTLYTHSIRSYNKCVPHFHHFYLILFKHTNIFSTKKMCL